MRALVFEDPHRFRFAEVPLPEPGPGEVRIRLARIGICGSDLHGYTGESGRRQPGMIMGHEASGWIDTFGAGVEGLTAGQLVTFIPTLPCSGRCGHVTENTCAELQVIGVTPSLQGAFADAIVVPASRVVPVDSLSPTVAAAVEPFAVGLHAARRADIQDGHRVLVVGGGMIGLSAARAALLEGATEVVVSDPLRRRQELAEAVGARGVSPSQVSTLGWFDRSIDAVGIGVTADTSLRAVPPGGTVCFVGLGLAQIDIPLFEIVAKERNVAGCFAYPDAVFRDAANALVSGAVNLDSLLGTMVDFSEAAEAFAGLADGSIVEAKVTVSTGATPPSDHDG